MSQEAKIEGYCLKCKEKRIMVDPRPEWASNGSPATRGTCPECGTTMYRRGATPLHEGLPKPEITAKPRKSKAKKKKSRKSSKTVRRSGKLVVVESPAKAKTIGKYLGRGYTVKSSVGHVRDLLKSRLSVDVDNKFEPEYRVPNEKRPVVKELKAAAEKAKEIYLATDPDREGEAIAWHVMESAEMDPARTQRVVFYEITKPAVEKALESPREIDMQRVNAQQARRILDRLVGYKLSPLLWRKVRGNLSAGRVQSVAVRLVVEREREIDEFVPEEYWTVDADLSQKKYAEQKPRPSFKAKWHRYEGKKLELRSEADVRPHLSVLERSKWEVGDLKVGTRRRRPAAPFTTSTLQQEASRKLRFNTTKTMRIAQQLYEGVDTGSGTVGLITYMRTDSVNVSAQAQAAARDYVINQYGNSFVPAKPPVYKTRSKAAQEAHEAIRPTDVRNTPKTIKSHLSRDQFRLYQLIWLRFVASQMASAVYDTVRADFFVGDESKPVKKRAYHFRATGSSLRFQGFLAVYEETAPSDRPDDGENTVPADILVGEVVDLLKLRPEQHFTQPPPRYGEATLVKALEENGIGRPSTYASIISTIQNRNYVVREDGRLYPTETGMVVNDMLVEYFPDVLSVDFTARLEDELDTIAQGDNEWVPVIDGFYRNFEKRLEVADASLPKVDLRKQVEPVGRKCPTCEEGDLVYRQGRFGKFIGCNRFPKCRHTEQVLVKVGVSCANGGEMVEKKTKRGRTFYGCSRYPDCEFTSWKLPVKADQQGIWIQQNKKDPSQTTCVACGLKPIEEREKEAEAAAAD
ncbi:MAG: type I DNA topoisomerase [Ardenticatenaceae bacterium]|nr:type I DNA topoisomerase [Ardenticatenaceae bacterium]